MKRKSGFGARLIMAVAGLLLLSAAAERILFVGNSFTFGAGSAVLFFHPELVHDLNHEGQGGVPAKPITSAVTLPRKRNAGGSIMSASTCGIAKSALASATCVNWVKCRVSPAIPMARPPR